MDGWMERWREGGRERGRERGVREGGSEWFAFGREMVFLGRYEKLTEGGIKSHGAELEWFLDVFARMRLLVGWGCWWAAYQVKRARSRFCSR